MEPPFSLAIVALVYSYYTTLAVSFDSMIVHVFLPPFVILMILNPRPFIISWIRHW